MNKVYLFLDTSQSSPCCLKIIDDQFNLVSEHYFHTQNNLIDLINPELNKLLAQVKLQLEDITRVYVNVGPGVFTGIRVGVNVAKTIQLVFSDVEIYTINALKLKCKGHGISVIDAKTKKFFLAVYDHNKEIVKPSLVDEQQVNEIIMKYNNLPVFGCEQTIDFDLNKDCYSLFNKCDEPINLEPLYLKPPF